MSDDAAVRLHESTVAHLGALEGGDANAAALDVEPVLAQQIFRAQLISRHCDFAARRLRAQGAGFYTISSAGHEGNAAVAAALSDSDPALLHYRSGAFFCLRALRYGWSGARAARDILLGVVASRDEPAAQGRHKVFGSLPLAIAPQTSTIASHLPKAVGQALALERRSRLGLGDSPDASVVMASFGDASANHSTAVGAIHTARHCAHVRLPLPVLFLCEDNGLGISVPTPPRWIEDAYGSLAGLRYFASDGLDAFSAYRVAKEASAFVRSERRPAFLHLRTVRYLGHAGSDVESAYRGQKMLREELRLDPIRRSAERLVAAGVLTPEETLALYREVEREVSEQEEAVVGAPRLRDRVDVMAPLALPAVVPPPPPPHSTARERFWGAEMPETLPPAPLGESIRRALGDLLMQYPEMLIFGEDVGIKGGVYGVTRGLCRRAGPARVFDTVLDEQSILGLALGAGAAGLLPIAEIQYLAYLHNAIDQVRGEAGTARFLSGGAIGAPLVVRVAAFADARGFGGHFHNEHSVASLRDVPGLVLAAPSRGEDAVRMLRTCVSLAHHHGVASVFLEPTALYRRRDLFVEGDQQLADPYPALAEVADFGRARVYGTGNAITFVSFANGVPISRRVAERLSARGVDASVVDLRWLAPLPIKDVLEAAARSGRILVVDETRRSGGVSEGVFAALIDRGYRGAMARVAAEDSFIPLGPAADHVLIDEDAVTQAALEMVEA